MVRKKCLERRISMEKRDSTHCKAQKNGKKRDLYTCQVCGSKLSSEGHHLIDYQFSGAADTNNIITLCQKCHKQVHRGNIDLISF